MGATITWSRPRHLKSQGTEEPSSIIRTEKNSLYTKARSQTAKVIYLMQIEVCTEYPCGEYHHYQMMAWAANESLYRISALSLRKV